MENGRFAPQEQIFHFHNISKNLTFQRSPKALVWSKGLKTHLSLLLPQSSIVAYSDICCCTLEAKIANGMDPELV